MKDTKELTGTQRQVLWFLRPTGSEKAQHRRGAAKEIGDRPPTIFKWRSRKLDALAAEETRMKLFERLPEVYEVLAKEAADGSPEHMKLFLRVTRGHDVPLTTPTAPDEPTALMWTESNAKKNEGDDDV